MPVRRELGGENLDRHLPVEHLVVGAPYDGHPTCPEALDEAIATPEYTDRVHVFDLPRSMTVQPSLSNVVT
ncbi:hypothetical protein Pme01_56850 [Planosporangium mesophilum]|uniref:Uncharacterized protein n=1 Tax=Planosporangium mesophilum TaxID=689768 RepID=A0A8J3X6V1_9ACTN|nr:hypothetical protein Pme01_56850 [Planosporangium mesophilum]